MVFACFANYAANSLCRLARNVTLCKYWVFSNIFSLSESEKKNLSHSHSLLVSLTLTLTCRSIQAPSCTCLFVLGVRCNPHKSLLSLAGLFKPPSCTCLFVLGVRCNPHKSLLSLAGLFKPLVALVYLSWGSDVTHSHSHLQVYSSP